MAQIERIFRLVEKLSNKYVSVGSMIRNEIVFDHYVIIGI